MTAAFITFIIGGLILALATLAYALAVVAKRFDDSQEKLRLKAAHKAAAQKQVDEFLFDRRLEAELQNVSRQIGDGELERLGRWN